MTTITDDEKPKVPFYYSNEHDQGMGVPAKCRCGQPLHLKPLGWTCDACGTGYGRDDMRAALTATAQAGPTVDTTKLNAGQLVQRIMRAMDGSDRPESTAKYAERIAAEILNLPTDYWTSAAQAGKPIGDDSAPEDQMLKIGKLIADLQSIKDKFGDTCVYIRRHGLSWGAVALNYRDDDKKNGVFDLQESHDREMLARLEQIERLRTRLQELEADRVDPPMPAAETQTESEVMPPEPNPAETPPGPAPATPGRADDAKAIEALNNSADILLKVDGDRDHMNQSNLTCEQVQIAAKLMRHVARHIAASPSPHAQSVEGEGDRPISSYPADTKSQAAARILRRWAGVLAIPSGSFVNLDLRECAEVIEQQETQIVTLTKELAEARASHKQAFDIAIKHQDALAEARAEAASKSDQIGKLYNERDVLKNELAEARKVIELLTIQRDKYRDQP